MILLTGVLTVWGTEACLPVGTEQPVSDRPAVQTGVDHAPPAPQREPTATPRALVALDQSEVPGRLARLEDNRTLDQLQLLGRCLQDLLLSLALTQS